MIGKSIWALAGALAMTATAASAQPFEGFYVGGAVGYNFSEDLGVRRGGPPTPQVKLRTDGGILGMGTVGYGFGNGWRVELEGNIRHAGIAGFGVPFAGPARGTLRTYGVIANALFDMDIGSPYVFPYVGAGAGYAWTDADNVVLPAAGGATRLSGTTGRPAVQGIAGASFPIPGVPGLSATAEYRFMGVIGKESFSAVSPAGGPTSLTFRNQYNHGVLIGLRYAFGVTPPAGAEAPVPVAAAAPSYIVFFDWDKANLSDRARAIVGEAARGATKAATTRIEVSGNTDTSGTPQYNQGLSMRRAENVASELVKDGVPKSAIAIQAFGETRPLVPTGPNVREPQNRRVEIVLK